MDLVVDTEICWVFWGGGCWLSTVTRNLSMNKSAHHCHTALASNCPLDLSEGKIVVSSLLKTVLTVIYNQDN